MKTKLLASAALLGVGLAVCVPAFAHHGNTAYDTSKVVVLKNAVVTKFAWANPHSFVMFDTKDDSGNVTHWAAEAGSPSSLTLLGWTRTCIEPGDTITVNLFQSKTGNPVGRLQKIVLADGKTTFKDSALGYLDPDSKDKKSE
jgi:uncharacterized protein DUF6152